MTTLALLILAAAIASGIGTALRLPGGPFALVLGLILTLVGAPLDDALVRDTLALSATFMVFVMSGEVEQRHISRFAKVSVSAAALHVGLIVVTGLPLAWAFGLDGWAPGYLVLALSAGSTLLVVDLLRRRERFYEPVGRITIGVSLVQDAAVIVGLSLLGAWGGGPLAILTVSGWLVVLAAAAYLLSRGLSERAVIGLRLDEEEGLIFLLTVFFVLVGVAHFAELPLVAGAFFAGVAVSRFPTSGLMRGYVSSLSDLFTLLFYAALGAVILLPSLRALAAVALVLFVAILTRPLLALLLMRRGRLATRRAIESVALLAQCGELALIVALVGVSRGHITDDTLGAIAIVVALSLTLARALSSDAVTWWLTHRVPGRRGHDAPDACDHLILIGGGESGAALLQALLNDPGDLLLIDEDPQVVARLEDLGHRALRGDATHPRTLTRAGAEHARAIICTLPRLSDARRLLTRFPNTPMLVRVFSQQEAETISALGGHPISESELAADAVLKWVESLTD